MMKQSIEKIKGQSYLEYVLVLGIISLVAFAMSPLIRRGVQAMTLVVADQIGNQADSDQDPSRGFLKTSDTDIYSSVQKSEINYGTYTYNDVTGTNSMTIINLGFQKNAGL